MPTSQIEAFERELRKKSEALDYQRVHRSQTYSQSPSLSQDRGSASSSPNRRVLRTPLRSQRGLGSEGKFAHISMLDSDVESEVGAATGGLEFTPKALPREKPALSSPPRVEEVVDEGEQEEAYRPKTPEAGQSGQGSRSAGRRRWAGVGAAVEAGVGAKVVLDKKPGDKGYWQMRAALAGVDLDAPTRIKPSATATALSPQAKKVIGGRREGSASQSFGAFSLPHQDSSTQNGGSSSEHSEQLSSVSGVAVDLPDGGCYSAVVSGLDEVSTSETGTSGTVGQAAI